MPSAPKEPTTIYMISRDSEGRIDDLFRILRTETELWSERYINHQWEEDDFYTQYLHRPEYYMSKVDTDQAEFVMRMLDKVDSDKP